MSSSTLARLYHDCFHIEAMLPQQIAEREAIEEWLRHETDVRIAESAMSALGDYLGTLCCCYCGCYHHDQWFTSR